MVDLLTQEEIDGIREDVKSILEDCDYAVNIIYRRYARSSSDFDPSTGRVTRTVTDTELRAFKGTLSAREVGLSGGLLKVGDEFFMFDPALMDAFPKPDDQIVQEITRLGHIALSNTANVVGYNTDFMLAGVQGGDVLDVEGVTANIESVSSDETLTLQTDWAGTIYATEFKIYRIYEITQRIIDPLRAACRLNVRRAGA